MTIERFQRAIDARPFRPFTIHLADGTMHRIVHRDFIAPSPVGRTVVVFHKDGSASILDLLLISALRVDAPRPRGRTGSK